MTPDQLTQKYAGKLTFLPVIDTEAVKTYVTVDSFTVESSPKDRVTIITQRHELIADANQADGWRHTATTVRLLVDRNMPVPVVDENGVPKTTTEEEFVGYAPYEGEVVEGVEPPQGEPVWEDVERARYITEWDMLYWGVYKKVIEPSLVFGIFRKLNITEYQGQPVPPLVFIEPNQNPE